MIGDLSIVTDLISQDWDVTRVNTFGQTALHMACTSRQSKTIPRIIQLLISNGSDVNALDNLFRTPVFHAAMSGNKQALSKLLQFEDCSVNICDHEEKTPLHAAVGNQQSQAIMILLYNDVDINAMDHKGKTALHYAVEENLYETVKKLLTYGADRDIKDLNGLSALKYAENKNNETMKNMLLFFHPLVTPSPKKSDLNNGKLKRGLSYGFRTTTESINEKVMIEEQREQEDRQEENYNELECYDGYYYDEVAKQYYYWDEVKEEYVYYNEEEEQEQEQEQEKQEDPYNEYSNNANIFSISGSEGTYLEFSGKIVDSDNEEEEEDSMKNIDPMSITIDKEEILKREAPAAFPLSPLSKLDISL